MPEVRSYGAASGRRRKRWSWWTLAKVGAALGLLLLAISSAYQVGFSQSATELVRLRHDVGELQEQSRQLTERAASAEQRAAMMVARVAQLQKGFEAKTPKGDAKRLLGLIQEKLDAGIDPERINFVLSQVDRPRNCDPKTDSRKLQPRTPLSTAPLTAVTFLNDKLTVTGQGATARSGDSPTETLYDPAQPVELRFTKIDGTVETAKGTLPLTHSLVVGDRELMFAAKAGAPGVIDLTMQSCAYP